MFGNSLDDFFGGRRYLQDPNERLTISKEQYEILKEKAEKFEALVAENRRIKSKNQELLDEIKILKEDARKLQELEEKTDKYLRSLVRAKEDLENYKKITDREKKQFKLYATEKILKKLIKHFDDLQRAEKEIRDNDSFKKGFQMLIKNFEKILEEEQVIPMNCEGQDFDPYKHEVILVKEDDLPENRIIEEVDKGYFYNNEVLRPARVIISKNKNIGI